MKMNGIARCAYRRLELAHVYRDIANELCGEAGDSGTARFFKKRAYYEKARAHALLEMSINTSGSKSMGLPWTPGNSLSRVPENEDFYAVST
ncbi:hypothetical protein [Azotobacter salinestris]|uniref:hypothetical protein n=1 Tax=Azotobacter salinestris TaxID=69964 RepID=UPI0032DE762F